MAANTVTVGPEQSLYSQELWVDDVNWTAIDHLSAPMRVYAKIRYRQTEQSSTVYPDESGKIRLLFDKPQGPSQQVRQLSFMTVIQLWGEE